MKKFSADVRSSANSVEEELRESRERLELVVQGAKAGIWDWDMKADQVFYDKQWKAILGYREDEIEGDVRLWTDRWHPDDSEKINKSMEDYLSGKTDKYEIEHRLRHKDGTFRWIRTTGKITRDRDGQPVRWTGFNIDITENKRIEELYIESEKRLREFAEAVPGASFIIDEDGRCLEIFGNQKMFHISKEDFIGKLTRELLPQVSAEFILNEVQAAIKTGKQRSGFTAMKLNDKVRYFSGQTVPLSYMFNGKRTAAVISCDITEQYRTQTALQTTYELRRRSDLVNGAINGTTAPDDELIYAFNQLGFDLSLPMLECVILSDALEYKGNPRTAEINNVQQRKEGMIILLSDLPGCLAWDRQDGIGVLCRSGFEIENWERSREIAALIRNKISEYDSGLGVNIGISEINVGIEGLKKGCRQALSAALAARCKMSGDADVVHYREAGIFQLLPNPIKGDAAKAFVDRHIGRLITYDKAKKTDYLATLEEFLLGTSLRETAEKQHLHIKSVVFRQKSIAKILNVNINDYEVKQALTLAVQLHKLNN